MKAAAVKAFAENDIDNFIIATIPGGIEVQEKFGQNNFVNNSTLPRLAPWEKLEQMGIMASSDADDLFKNCTLPQGWKKVATDHSMWSNLVDERGRIRASIFYKAAFYDRSAHLSLNKRFSIGVVPEDFYKSDQSYEDRQSGKWAAVVNDCNKVVFSTD